MPIIDGPDFPIRREPVTGPGVDAFVNRKEPGKTEKFDVEKSLKWLTENRERLADALKAILRS